ncbi:hypothetical protein [Fodinibius sp. AD559]|uniref:hypothetical protein n=1 Tax=Fodinibius sp. AD559 TaxID=3424179 RepID=UPI004046B2B5
MKYLKIENNKGYYLKPTEEDQEDYWEEIDEIGKEDLMKLLNKAISSEFEMDDYQEENLAHKAHQIVYKNIFEKFSDLLDNKTRFKDESESLYKEAIEKYSTSDS